MSLEYLMTGKDVDKKESKLTSKDERDISKTVNALMEKLESHDGAPLFSTETRNESRSYKFYSTATENHW